MNPNDKNQINNDQEEIRLNETLSRIKHKIIVLSGKGGVGKSTVAVNLAASLAASGKKTGIMDVDIHGPSVPKLLGIEKIPLDQQQNRITPVQHSNNLKVMSIGSLLPDSSEPVVWRGPLKHNAIKQFIMDVEWGDLDYLVVDSPPGTGDEPLSVCQLIKDPAGAVIVTTPQDISLLDVRKSVTFCKRINLPILGVVENMSGFQCPHCSEVIDIFKSGGGEKMAEEMGVAFLGKLPLDPVITSGGDNGKPFSTDEKESTSLGSKNFKSIVDQLISKVEGK
ncbi:MAG: Mrp/NBP35 family ATP-binding protein [Spirochaetota bacterium]